MRYLMTLSYDGSNYKGYQKQNNEKTIQAEIEKQLTKLNGEKKCILHASGRTDAHVHALNQKAHFDLDKRLDTMKLQRALNRLLPDDIYIQKIEEVNSSFHARFDVIKKSYVYKINIGVYNPFERNYVYQYNQPLIPSEMERALKYLEGTHNFKAFTKVDEEKESYERTIYKASLQMDGNYIIFSFLGNGFLRYMVRNMIGTLIEIGEQKRSPEDIVKILESEDRCQAGKTAPPEGLYLEDVFYS